MERPSSLEKMRWVARALSETRPERVFCLHTVTALHGLHVSDHLARGLESNADLLQFSRGAPSTPPFGFAFPRVTASLRLGYFGRRAKTAANRRLFAGRRLRGCRATFARQQIGARRIWAQRFAPADSGGGAEARTPCPASAAAGPAAAPHCRRPRARPLPPARCRRPRARPPASRYSGESVALTPGGACP